MIFKLISKAFRSNAQEVLGRPSFPGFQKSASLASVPSPRLDPNELEEELKTGGFKVKVKKGLRTKTLFRFLLAKLMYEEDGIHLDEYIVLFTLYSDLVVLEDAGFREKYDDWFFRHHKFFSELGRATSFPVRLNMNNVDEMLLKQMSPLLPSKQAYFGLKGQRNIRLGYEIQLNSSLPPVRVQPKAFIGVGYRDKGTRRDLAKNGNPSWQEVSCHNFELDRRAEEELSESSGHLGPPLE
jgi:hypothetical protein